jgi:quercetin dioxygenase-like cupin family protein
MMKPKEIIRAGQIEIRFLLDTEDTGGRMAMFEFVVPAGAKVPAAHYHEQVDEAIYGIEGELTFVVEGKSAGIGPGDRCFVPRGAAHHFVNAGTETTRTLAVLTPGTIGAGYFREMAELINGGGAVDMGKVEEVMRRHGLVVVRGEM